MSPREGGIEEMSVVRLQQKSYQIEDRAMEGYAMAYRAYLARRDLPGPRPTFADFVEIRKMQERIEGLPAENFPVPYDSDFEPDARRERLIDGSFFGIVSIENRSN
jgi:hypothetical protein